ncbi:InlB B-repeat-containing protein [Neglectibacter timonensis]|uniref:InlB B-repeat-containing protein n=1 Tax=Neglectibacter timonensis TaxID=1776382 RepID=A0ABT1RVZ4_9FIRM|nr:InlB B-repeat-containing protein [Neglectibacter timonensis]MCQ4838853.1 InlB B-repeat-containing protein [Neglectibacter timonensis]MCQ4842724.1 InlB B-repeat-containing protein [Neglectibacter timonensis]
MKRRILSLLLSVVMVITMAPTAAMAAQKETGEAAESSGFTDVSGEDWFYGYVVQAVEKKLFGGVGEDRFDPSGTMSRAMFVTVVGRMAGVDTSLYSGNGGYSDVTAGSWYAPYVVWASENKVAQGYGGGKFGPNDAVTREQMAAMLLRWATAAGIQLKESAGGTEPKDLAAVSVWAKETILVLWRAGLLQGDENGKVNPAANATRAECAAFCVRADDAVDAYYTEAGIPRPGHPSEGGSTTYYAVTFETKGGSELSPQSLPSGTALGNLPSPYKAGEIFLGWYYDEELNQAVASSDRLTGSLTLYAKYEKAGEIQENGSARFTAAMDVEPGFTIAVKSAESQSAEAVKALITAKNLSTDTEGDIVTVKGENGSFTISSADKSGFEPGSAYKLTLNDDDLTFDGQPASVREYNFTVKREDEAMDLVLSEGLKYIPAGNISDVTEDGESVESLDAALLTVGKNEDGTTEAIKKKITGTFQYSGGETLKEGDTVAVYEGMHPDRRKPDGQTNALDDADANPEKNAAISYVKITKIESGACSYESAEVDDVLFTPDVLPVPEDADLDGEPNNDSITVGKSVMTYTDDRYAEMGLDSQTTIDVGDYIAFYSGDFEEESGNGESSSEVTGYGRITSVGTEENGNYVIGYEEVEEEEVLAAMDVYETDNISGEALLEDVDRTELENSIARQAENSGFVEEASQFLADTALQTDSFSEFDSDLSMTAFSVTGGEGLPLRQNGLLRGANGENWKVEITKKSVNASIGTKLQHFKGLSGVRAELTVGIEITVTSPAGGEIVMNVMGTFQQEVRIAVNVSGGADWKWKWKIFPYISDYHAAVSADLYDYTGIEVKATVTSGDKTEDISEQMKTLLEQGGDSSMSAALQKRYQEMLNTQTEWVDLFTQPIFNQRFNVALIFTVEFSVDFVVSADVNISLGCKFEYENAKRYVYNIKLFSGTVTSDTIDLVEERYEFEFYVMGTLGLKAGIRAEISLSLITKSVAYVAVTAEAGAYVKLWGYFYYRLVHTASAGTDKGTAGALLLEVGAYLEITFTASAIGGRYSYHPTLYDNEWPLWSAGTQQNVTGFSYAQSEAPKVALKKYYTTYSLPDSIFSMDGMDLKTGRVTSRTYSADDFTITITNPAFTYQDGIVTVNPGDQPRQDGEMIITWKGQPLAFSSAPIKRTISLHWDNLKDGYYIAFNSNGGSAVGMITKAYGAAVTAPSNPTRLGYVFGGWYQDDQLQTAYTIPATMPNEDVQVYAKWTPATDTKYTVEHYKQELNGAYALAESEPLQGTTETTVTPTVKTYTGFDSPAAQNVQILPDGSALVRYYYPRKSYTVTFQSGISDIEDVTSTFKYEAAILAPGFATAGYTFGGWGTGLPQTMPAEDLTVTASWTPSDDTPYRVEHYVQRPDGTSYELKPVVNQIGATNGTLTLSALYDESFLVPGGISYDHATVEGKTVSTADILADGSLVVKLYYIRNEHVLTWHFNGGTTEDAYTQKSIYGSTITAPANVIRTGYDFMGWYTDEQCMTPLLSSATIPTADMDIYAKWEARRDTVYTVEYYQQNVDDDGYTLVAGDTQSLQGTTDTKTESFADEDKYEFFTLNPSAGGYLASGTIAGDGSLVLKLYYDRNSFTVDYSVDGISYDNQQTYRYGKMVVFPQEPTKEGYNFGGWQLEGSDFNGVMPGKNITLEAVWLAETEYAYTVEYYKESLAGSQDFVERETLTGEFDSSITVRPSKEYEGFTEPGTQEVTIKKDLTIRFEYTRNSYNLTWELNGGTASNEYTYGTTKYGAPITVPSPNKTGYTFDGWDKTAISAMPAEDQSFSARWKINQYTISFDAKGGSSVSSITQDYATPVSQPSAPTYRGYTFEGWYSDETLEAKYIFGAMPAQNITLYAKWKAVDYAITYYLNEGSLTGEKTTYIVTDSFTLPAPTKTGNTFAGWCTSSALTDPNLDVSITDETGDKEFWAKWTVNQYTITFVSNSELSVDAITQDYGTPVTAPEPTRSHYTFDKWYSDSSLTTPYTFATMPAQSITLYAKWTPVTYTITYNLNQGALSGSDSNPTAYTVESDSITLKNPTRTGYTFAGWMNTSTSKTVTTIPKGSTGNMSLTAQWNTVPYTISYNVDGGTPLENPPASYTVETETFTLPQPKKEGYNFTGWTGSNGTTAQTEVTIVKGNTGNKEYKANWKPITYTLKLADTVSKNADGRADLYQKFGGSGMTVSYDQSVSITNITGLTGFTTSKGNIGTTFMNLTENQGETVILTPVWKTDAIYSHSQWAAIWDNLSGNYKLGADLDLQNETITRIGNGTEQPFTGQIDGQNHTIRNFKTNTGLFDVLAEEASVMNLIIENEVTGYWASGAVAQRVEKGNVRITGVTVKGCTIGASTGGGLIGDIGRIDGGDAANLAISGCTIDSTVKWIEYGGSSERTWGAFVGRVNTNSSVSAANITNKTSLQKCGQLSGDWRELSDPPVVLPS